MIFLVCSWADTEELSSRKPSVAIVMNKYSAFFFIVIRLLRFPSRQMASVEGSVDARVEARSSVETAAATEAIAPRPEEVDSWRPRAPAKVPSCSLRIHEEP